MRKEDKYVEFIKQAWRYDLVLHPNAKWLVLVG